MSDCPSRIPGSGKELSSYEKLIGLERMKLVKNGKGKKLEVVRTNSGNLRFVILDRVEVKGG